MRERDHITGKLHTAHLCYEMGTLTLPAKSWFTLDFQTLPWLRGFLNKRQTFHRKGPSPQQCSESHQGKRGSPTGLLPRQPGLEKMWCDSKRTKGLNLGNVKGEALARLAEGGRSSLPRKGAICSGSQAQETLGLWVPIGSLGN